MCLRMARSQYAGAGKAKAQVARSEVRGTMVGMFIELL